MLLLMFLASNSLSNVHSFPYICVFCREELLPYIWLQNRTLYQQLKLFLKGMQIQQKLIRFVIRLTFQAFLIVEIDLKIHDCVYIHGKYHLHSG